MNRAFGAEKAVKLPNSVHTLVWPSGADFDPAILHDRPEHEAAFKAAARRWSERAALKEATEFFENNVGG